MTPSGEAWIKLAALAAKRDPSEALFFWAQLGIRPEALLSVADLLLKDRVRDQKALMDEGKGVLIPPFTEGAWEIQASFPPELLDAKRVPNKSSTYYIVTPQPPGWGSGYGGGFVPGMTIVFDTSGASEGSFLHFQGQEVLVNFETRGAGAWPDGLYIGRPGIIANGPVRDMVLGPRDRPQYDWRPGDGVILWSFRPEHYMPHDMRGKFRVDSPTADDWHKAHRAAETETIAGFRFPAGCRLLGRVRGQFPPDRVEHWSGKY